MEYNQDAKTRKEKIKAVLGNPIFLASIAGGIKGVYDAKDIERDFENQFVAEKQREGRRFFSFIDARLYNKGITDTEQIIEHLRKVEHPASAFLDTHNVIVHISKNPVNSVIEMIPKEDVIRSGFVQQQGWDRFKTQFQAYKPSVVKGVVTTGGTVGAAMGAMKLYNVIKDKMAENESTKEVVACVKEELEKRATDSALDKVTSLVDIDLILSKVINEGGDN